MIEQNYVSRLLGFQLAKQVEEEGGISWNQPVLRPLSCWLCIACGGVISPADQLSCQSVYGCLTQIRFVFKLHIYTLQYIR